MQVLPPRPRSHPTRQAQRKVCTGSDPASVRVPDGCTLEPPQVLPGAETHKQDRLGGQRDETRVLPVWHGSLICRLLLGLGLPVCPMRGQG